MVTQVVRNQFNEIQVGNFCKFGVKLKKEADEPTSSIFEPMLVTPSDFNISISSASDLEIDWGDGTVQTVKSGDDTALEHLGLICKNYTHTYTDSYVDKTISVKHLDGESPIQFFTSGAIKTVERWYSEGYQPFELINTTGDLILNMTFFDLGSQLETVPNIAPPKTNVLSGLFQGAQAFNQDISSWDVSNVTNLSYTFANTAAFNQDIGDWDVSKVTDMGYIFQNATSFNQDISGWDVGSAEEMSYMFFGATAFNQDISNWDTGNVTNMFSMFQEATSFNQDIGSWDVSSVADMSMMFAFTTTFNQDLSGWDVSSVEAMEYMFYGATAFNQDISKWCVPLISSLPSDFADGSALIADSFPVWGTCPS